jgi:hypothetical protein
MPKFESHITFHINDADKVKALGETRGWKFSQIEGDALMGAKPYCYLTAYDPNERTMFSNMLSVVAAATDQSVGVLRTKIERIIWDSKTGVDELEKPSGQS